MWKIGVKDFIPPLVNRVRVYIKKRFLQAYNRDLRTAPFDSIPADIKPKWILDIGANVGDITISALNSFPDAHVICFEPVLSTFEILTERLKSYTGRVHLYNSALSNAEGKGKINITNFPGANSIMPQAKFHQECNPHVHELSKEAINLVRLDDIAIEFPAKYIDILKIDVEGFELNVLNGGKQFISNNVGVITIEISLMRDVSWDQQAVFDIFEFMANAGFCLVNVFDVHHAVDKPIMLAQMDCVFRHKRELEKL